MGLPLTLFEALNTKDGLEEVRLWYVECHGEGFSSAFYSNRLPSLDALWKAIVILETAWHGWIYSVLFFGSYTVYSLKSPSSPFMVVNLWLCDISSRLEFYYLP